MMTTRQTLEAMLRTLQEADEVVVLTAQLGEPASAQDLEALRTRLHGALPADVEAHYAQVGSVQLRWMAASSPRYLGHEAEFVRGTVPWSYAIWDTVTNQKEDGVLILPPIEVLLAQDWSEELEEGHGLVIDDEEIDEDAVLSEIVVFDWSHFYVRPALLRRTGQVAVGTKYGADWDVPHLSFEAYIAQTLRALEERLGAARRGELGA